MSWFAQVFGFEEERYEATTARFRLVTDRTNTLVDRQTDEQFVVGSWEVLSFSDLARRRKMLAGSAPLCNQLVFKNLACDVRTLFADSANRGAVFQVASQFNCLEMTSPEISPRHGITRYVTDRSQGPACALSCPAATLFRNYFAQSPDSQINTMSALERLVNNYEKRYWDMNNGYLIPTSDEALREFAQVIDKPYSNRYLDAQNQLQVGIHWDTPVYISASGGRPKPAHTVTQIFCAAVPIAYTNFALPLWEPLARLILVGAYRTTLQAALCKSDQQDPGVRTKVYLTVLGGGAFGVPQEWIGDAIEQVVLEFRFAPLDVFLVHYMTVAQRWQSWDARLQNALLPNRVRIAPTQSANRMHPSKNAVQFVASTQPTPTIQCFVCGHRNISPRNRQMTRCVVCAVYTCFQCVGLQDENCPGDTCTRYLHTEYKT